MDEQLLPLLAECEEEKMVTAISTHWIKYCSPMIIFAIVVTGAWSIIVLAILSVSRFPFLYLPLFFAGLIPLHITHHWFFHRMLGEAMEDVILTNKRVIWIHESLFQQDTMRQVPLEKIQGVEVRKAGMLQTILGFGSLWFDTGGTTTHDVGASLHLVPRPHRIARIINQLLKLK